MTYQVLARKWRPQRFSELIGQGPIVQALQNALTDGRIAQAYLFSGIRGVGKTTAARLLAKALNCEKGPTGEPCNECVTCQEITQGSDLDVVEVDAATYSKVEQVRDLTESLKYSPARDRYKIAVLDEIHRLSRQAFDALLKIVEEPPKHLVFIFATTEVDAVPATVLSRCQEFRFRRVPVDELAGHLGNISEAEEITVSPTALRLIARAGEGSVRDSVALLDQLATFGSGTIEDVEAARLLGGLDSALQEDLLRAMLAGDPITLRKMVHRLEEDGWDPRHAFVHFLSYCRDALHLAMRATARGSDKGDAGPVDRTEDEIERIGTLAREAGYENLLRLLHHLLSSEPIVRRSEAPFLALEIAWLRAAELPKLVLLEDLLAGRSPGPSLADATAAAQAAPVTNASPEAASKAVEAPKPEKKAAPAKALEKPKAEKEEKEEPAASKKTESKKTESKKTAAVPATEEKDALKAKGDEPAPLPSSPGPMDLDPSDPGPMEPDSPGSPSQRSAPERSAPEKPAPAKPKAAPKAKDDPPPKAATSGVPALMEAVGTRRQPLAAHLGDAQRIDIEDGQVVIVTPAGDPLLARALERASNKKVMDEAVADVFGQGTTWSVTEGDQPIPKTAEPASQKEEPVETSDPAVQIVLDLFQGKVEDVEDLDGSSTEES